MLLVLRLAAGARPRQQMMIWVKALKDGPAIQVSIDDGRLKVAIQLRQGLAAFAHISCLLRT